MAEGESLTIEVARYLTGGGLAGRQIDAEASRPDSMTAPALVLQVQFETGRVVVGQYPAYSHQKHGGAQVGYQIEIYDASNRLLDVAWEPAYTTAAWIAPLFREVWRAYQARLAPAQEAVRREIGEVGLG